MNFIKRAKRSPVGLRLDWHSGSKARLCGLQTSTLASTMANKPVYPALRDMLVMGKNDSKTRSELLKATQTRWCRENHLNGWPTVPDINKFTWFNFRGSKYRSYSKDSSTAMNVRVETASGGTTQQNRWVTNSKSVAIQIERLRVALPR